MRTTRPVDSIKGYWQLAPRGDKIRQIRWTRCTSDDWYIALPICAIATHSQIGMQFMHCAKDEAVVSCSDARVL